MIRLTVLLLALATPLAAQPARPPVPMPFHDIVKIVGQRFHGRLLAARLDDPRPYEFAHGTLLVQELTLLTPQGHVLLIRLDGVTGQVLELRGRGITAARVKPPSGEGGNHDEDDD